MKLPRQENVFVPNANNDPRITQHDDPSLVLRSLIYSPLIHDDHIIGVLVVANPKRVTIQYNGFVARYSLAEQSGALAIKNSDAMNLRLEKSRMDTILHFCKRCTRTLSC